MYPRKLVALGRLQSPLLAGVHDPPSFGRFSFLPSCHLFFGFWGSVTSIGLSGQDRCADPHLIHSHLTMKQNLVPAATFGVASEGSWKKGWDTWAIPSFGKSRIGDAWAREVYLLPCPELGHAEGLASRLRYHCVGQPCAAPTNVAGAMSPSCEEGAAK